MSTTTISTARPYRPARLTVARVIKLMRGGATLHCSVGPANWWLSNDWSVGTPVAERVIQHPDIAGVGDCLFGTEYSQTFRYIEG
jgi:hypothetical protein